MDGRLFLACALTAGALVACQSDTQGTPTTSPQSPAEPSFPTSRPSTSRTNAAAPTKTPPSSPSSPVSPPAAEVLPPQESGYVFIETKSGQTRCQINEGEVGCEAQFTNSPMQDGVRANGVRLTADGAVEWVVGNLGDIPVVTLDYRTYRALGWTIVAAEDGTRFTNDDTGHGMVVAIEGVETF
jgi:hypothetical protein